MMMIHKETYKNQFKGMVKHEDAVLILSSYAVNPHPMRVGI